MADLNTFGSTLVERGAATLNKLSSRIDTTKMAPPSFKMVLTAVGDIVYRRPDDDVIVCPIGALKP